MGTDWFGSPELKVSQLAFEEEGHRELPVLYVPDPMSQNHGSFTLGYADDVQKANVPKPTRTTIVGKPIVCCFTFSMRETQARK